MLSAPTSYVIVRLKLRTCSTNVISMKSSRLASSVTSHSLIIVREFDLVQGISEPHPGSPTGLVERRGKPVDGPSGYANASFFTVAECACFYNLHTCMRLNTASDPVVSRSQK